MLVKASRCFSPPDKVSPQSETCVCVCVYVYICMYVSECEKSMCVFFL
jgi:hypothetical protein